MRGLRQPRGRGVRPGVHAARRPARDLPEARHRPDPRQRRRHPAPAHAGPVRDRSRSGPIRPPRPAVKVSAPDVALVGAGRGRGGTRAGTERPRRHDARLARPSFPPGRQTRASSAATAAWSGAKMVPNDEATTSKLGHRISQPLAVADLELDRQPSGGGELAGRREEARRQIDAHHGGPRPGCPERERPGPGGDVQPGLARSRCQAGDEAIVDVGERLGDPLERRRAPADSLARLQLCESIHRHLGRVSLALCGSPSLFYRGRTSESSIVERAGTRGNASVPNRFQRSGSAALTTDRR